MFIKTVNAINCTQEEGKTRPHTHLVKSTVGVVSPSDRGQTISVRKVTWLALDTSFSLQSRARLLIAPPRAAALLRGCHMTGLITGRAGEGSPAPLKQDWLIPAVGWTLQPAPVQWKASGVSPGMSSAKHVGAEQTQAVQFSSTQFSSALNCAVAPSPALLLLRLGSSQLYHSRLSRALGCTGP